MLVYFTAGMYNSSLILTVIYILLQIADTSGRPLVFPIMIAVI